MRISGRILGSVILLGFAFLATSAARGFAAEIAPGQRLDIGYASVTGNRIPLWVAHDIGIFKRHGLTSQLIYVASSSQGIPALVSGQIPIFSGSPETAAQATASGAELVVIASAPPTPYKLLAQPHIKVVDELRGKKIGIDRIGGSSYYATRRMLQKLGIQPDSVEFLQIAGGGAQRVAAFQSGLISAIVSTVERFERSRIPYSSLADAIELGIRVVGSSYITTKSFLTQNGEVVVRFMRALIEANHWSKDPKNKEIILRIYSRHLRTTYPEVLELNYRLYVEPLPLFPFTDSNDLRANLAALAESNPKLKNFSIADFINNSFVQSVRQEVGK